MSIGSTPRWSVPALGVSVLLLVACGGGGDRTTPSGPDDSSEGPTPASLSVSPGEADLGALDDTARFSATVQDQDGNVISGVSVTWTSTRESVASVDDGSAVAKGNGLTEIVAAAEGLRDSSSLTVDQRASRVTVSPDADTIVAGDSLQLSASAADANGRALANPGVIWSSSDTSVATVDSIGLVRARRDGSADVTATVDGTSGGSTLEVAPPPDGAPVVTAVIPTPLPEGDTATIDGSNFSVDPDANTVHVDGVPAQVLSATASSLQIVVPTYGCLPTRTVGVEVSTSLGSDSGAFQLDPDGSAVSLSVGRMTRIEDPAEFCLQFEGSSSTERYLVGVQSVADSAKQSLTPVEITAEAADGSGSALEASLDDGGRLGGGGAAGGDVRIPERWRNHREAEIRLRRAERELWRTGDVTPLAAESTGPVVRRISVDSTTGAGDTVSIRVPDIGATGSACDHYTEIGAVVKAIGTRAIIVADTANPGTGYTDADYRDLSERIDQDIFSTQVTYFGNPTDADRNGHIVAVFTKELNRTAPNTLGFVHSANLLDRSSCPASNEGEYFYGKAPDPGGVYGSTYSVDEAKEDAPSVMAHELAHVIQQSRRLLNGKPYLGSIVAEAQATLSEEVVGHAVTGRKSGENYGFSVALNSDRSDEVQWYAGAFYDLMSYFGSGGVSGAPEECGWWQDSPSPCGGRSLWYGVGWSFLRWVTDQYGPGHAGGKTAFHRDLAGGDRSGLRMIETLTGESLEKLMARWAASLYVDDRIANVAPSLETASWDYYDIFEPYPEDSKLVPAEMGFGDWTLAGDVRASSTAYVAVESAGRPATAIRVRGSTGGTLPSDMQIWIVRLQ